MRELIAMVCVAVFHGAVFAGELGWTAPPIEIPGAAVASEADARRAALAAYVKKTDFAVSATEGTGQAGIVRLGFEIRGFAEKGEPIWQVPIRAIGMELRAIIWINPRTAKVLFVVGPWMTGDKHWAEREVQDRKDSKTEAAAEAKETVKQQPQVPTSVEEP